MDCTNSMCVTLEKRTNSTGCLKVPFEWQTILEVSHLETLLSADDYNKLSFYVRK